MDCVNSVGEADLLMCKISRKTIETKDIAQVAANLAKLTHNAATIQKLRDKLIVIVDGYDNDPQPLWCIEEVRQCLALLNGEFPYWFHFCEKEGGTLEMLALCLTPLTMGQGGIAMATSDDYNAFLLPHLDAVEELHRRKGIPGTETVAVMKEVGSYYQKRLNWFPKGEG